MIERLLAAESAFGRDEVEVAGRLFAQVAEADPRNAIAVVGLARVAHREGRRDEAKALAERALAIDPQEAEAARLLRELLLGDSRLASTPLPEPISNLAPERPPTTTPANAPSRRPSILDRFRAWLSGGRRA